MEYYQQDNEGFKSQSVASFDKNPGSSISSLCKTLSKLFTQVSISSFVRWDLFIVLILGLNGLID